MRAFIVAALISTLVWACKVKIGEDSTIAEVTGNNDGSRGRLICKTIDKKVDESSGREMIQAEGREHFLAEMKYGEVTITVSSLARKSDGMIHESMDSTDLNVLYSFENSDGSSQEIAHVVGSIDKLFKTVIQTPDGRINTTCFIRG